MQFKGDYGSKVLGVIVAVGDSSHNFTIGSVFWFKVSVALISVTGTVGVMDGFSLFLKKLLLNKIKGVEIANEAILKCKRITQFHS